LAEITAPDYPGERLIVCRNPELARERARKRDKLLAATERNLSRIVAHVRRRYAPLRGKAGIGLAAGAVIDRHKMAKHYEITITDDSFTYRCKPESIARETRLDGLYLVRTSLPAETLSAEEAVRAYKDLARVERAFRSLKSIDLQIRPVHHWVEPRVRAHVFLCMMAYYVEWHLREAWAPILFHDHERAEAEKERASPLAALEVSAAAKRKRGSRRSDDGLPITSFGDLIRHLATMTLNVVASPQAPSAAITRSARPTPLQDKALALLDTALPRVQ
jgi:Transposase DDE domain